MASEFELIRRFFGTRSRHCDRTLLGVGDDAALLRPDASMALAVSTDMLIAGRHFRETDDPAGIGHKSLAVNLSDLAAMGATPRWATLSLALPDDDEAWLGAFCRGLFALLDQHRVDLVGGDTVRGPRTISVTIVGEVPEAYAITRAGAAPGDDIWVSGELGAAALALAHAAGEAGLEPAVAAATGARLHRPDPRVDLGERLRGLASAAIDVSDGFAADLGHILERSGVGALVHYESLPAAAAFGRLGRPALQRRCVLSGGDDYELVFTASQARRPDIAALARELGLALTRVGSIQPDGADLVVLDAVGARLEVPGGFDHFAGGA